jgi:acetolactate synthase-1/2/3 large subunit
MDAGTALVECLIDCGLDTGFTVPGESFLPVLEALRQRRERFRLVSMRHEGGCTFAALGYSARAGKPALVMSVVICADAKHFKKLIRCRCSPPSAKLC